MYFFLYAAHSDPAHVGRKDPAHSTAPEIVIRSPHHHHAVISSDLLPEIFHCFNVALQGVLTNDEEHRGLHLQQGVVNILQENGKLQFR